MIHFRIKVKRDCYRYNQSSHRMIKGRRYVSWSCGIGGFLWGGWFPKVVRQ